MESHRRVYLLLRSGALCVQRGTRSPCVQCGSNGPEVCHRGPCGSFRGCTGVTGSAVGNALYDASGRRTRRRGPTRRERTTRRTVSYKASGPDASGMYDASYSVVQGVVQHQHRTTQYDIVRPPSPSRRVNDGSGPSWGKGAFGPLPKYWHFASTTCRQCLQLAGRVYLWCTVSTDPRPPSPCAECCLIEGGGQSVA